MSLDILYLTWNRRAFTERTLPALIANTDWGLVRRLIVYDDNSVDGTRRFVEPALREAGLDHALLVTRELRSPVRTMNHYLDGDPAERFVKLDNDIMVPPGWLERLLSVSDRFPQLELLGMEASMSETGVPPADPLALPPEQYTWVESSHIGGVGLMRASAFLNRHPRPKPMGRFGFTEWQHTHRPVRGWIAPDLLVCDLSRCPGQPWEHLSWEHVSKGWQRSWPVQRDLSPVYWEWFTNEEAVA